MIKMKQADLTVTREVSLDWIAKDFSEEKIFNLRSPHVSYWYPSLKSLFIKAFIIPFLIHMFSFVYFRPSTYLVIEGKNSVFSIAISLS